MSVGSRDDSCEVSNWSFGVESESDTSPLKSRRSICVRLLWSAVGCCCSDFYNFFFTKIYKIQTWRGSTMQVKRSMSSQDNPGVVEEGPRLICRRIFSWKEESHGVNLKKKSVNWKLKYILDIIWVTLTHWIVVNMYSTLVNAFLGYLSGRFKVTLMNQNKLVSISIISPKSSSSGVRTRVRFGF